MKLTMEFTSSLSSGVGGSINVLTLVTRVFSGEALNLAFSSDAAEIEQMAAMRSIGEAFGADKERRAVMACAPPCSITKQRHIAR